MIALSIGSCEKEKRRRNPFLQEAKFKEEINLNLPRYIKLRHSWNAVLVDNVGLRGIVVINIGNNYMAWDRACPSQALSDCSQMTLESDHRFMLCPCTGVKYDLAIGLPLSGTSPYPMLNYQVVKQGDVLVIFN